MHFSPAWKPLFLEVPRYRLTGQNWNASDT